MHGRIKRLEHFSFRPPFFRDDYAPIASQRSSSRVPALRVFEVFHGRSRAADPEFLRKRTYASGNMRRATFLASRQSEQMLGLTALPVLVPVHHRQQRAVGGAAVAAPAAGGPSASASGRPGITVARPPRCVGKARARRESAACEKHEGGIRERQLPDEPQRIRDTTGARGRPRPHSGMRAAAPADRRAVPHGEGLRPALIGRRRARPDSLPAEPEQLARRAPAGLQRILVLHHEMHER